MPFLHTRRMEVAAHLTDHVLPTLPLRQWVLSLPKGIRPFMPPDPRLAGDVLRVLLRAIRTTLRRASPSATGDAQLGAERTLQRRLLRLFQRRGLLDEDTVENMLTWQASGGFSRILLRKRRIRAPAPHP
jgi:hypothetical protein